MSFSFKAYGSDQIRGSRHFTAADPEDIEILDNKIASIRQSLIQRATKEELESEINACSKKIQNILVAYNNLKSELEKTLISGVWKKAFRDDISSALNQIEKRFNELNAELDKKMIILAQLEPIIKEIESIFVKQETRMRSIIITAGEEAQKRINKDGFLSELLSILSHEAQNISWEKNNVDIE